MTITKSSLRSSVFTTIRSILVAASLLSGTVKITGFYSDEDENLPELVIGNANIDKENFSFNRSNYTDNIVVILEIYTKKSIDIDTILDEMDNLSTLKKIDGVQLIGWSESRDFSEPNENKVHVKMLTLTYSLR